MALRTKGTVPVPPEEVQLHNGDTEATTYPECSAVGIERMAVQVTWFGVLIVSGTG